MSKAPKISVVMPAYNADRFISETIQSILDQSFNDFELIIIDDGSIDNTGRIIKSFEDQRIRYIKNPQNIGLAASLNIGIKEARGLYIARMDADDISTNDRLEKQASFLDHNPFVGIVGSSILEIDSKNRPIRILKKPKSHILIKWSSLFSTPMYHPTIMARSDILKSHHYDEHLSNSEDYELWSRLLFSTDIHFANFSEPLLNYRIYPESFTQTLNLDKRVLSAHNTIRNIDHYMTLSQGEKDLFVRFKQEQNISIKNLSKIFFIYIESLASFRMKEHLGIKSTLKLYPKIFQLAWFLIKYKLKH